jgi:hypothetical protein
VPGTLAEGLPQFGRANLGQSHLGLLFFNLQTDPLCNSMIQRVEMVGDTGIEPVTSTV